MDTFPTAGPAPVASPLSAERAELIAWMQRNSPSLAETYRGALILLESRQPGHVRFIAHTVRDIRNILPRVVSGAKGAGRLDYVGQIQNIKGKWESAGLISADLSNKERPSASDSLTVPAAAFKPLLKLFREHETTSQKKVLTARQFFVDAVPENAEHIGTLEPVIQQWLEVTEWFMKRAHDDGRCDAECPREALEHYFEMFERSLMAIVRGFYPAVKELDEILAEANS
jgi:hypothetical protein